MSTSLLSNPLVSKDYLKSNLGIHYFSISLILFFCLKGKFLNNIKYNTTPRLHKSDL